MSAEKFEIRPAEKKDVPVILDLIKALADYEKLTHEVVAETKDIEDSLFGDNPAAEAVIAWYGNKAAGFALFFHNFSTFKGKRGLYLEDLFVRPEYRGKGFGKKLLLYLAKIAVERGCARFEWSVLDWNEPAIKFYEKLGGEMMHEWRIFRLTGEELENAAAMGEI